MTRAPRWSAATTLALVAAVALSSVACVESSEGRALRPPRSEQTTTTAAEVATTAPATGGDASVDGDGSTISAAPVEPLTLSSPAITESGAVPVRYTCRGEEVSPPLVWSTVPPGTVEVAVVVRDVTAAGFVHWVVAGIRPDLVGLAEGELPEGVVEAANDFGRPGWAGPCPPSGTHDYEFRVYALAEPSGVVAGAPGAEAAAAVEFAPGLASAVLSATASAG